MIWIRKIDLVSVALLLALFGSTYFFGGRTVELVVELIFGLPWVIYYSFFWKKLKPAPEIDPMKKKFLVGEDDGQESRWAIFYARSPEDIRRKFPNAHVFQERPEAMDNYAYAVIEAGGSFDIDGDPPPWFAGRR